MSASKSPAYLNALRAFEASARHRSVSGAAGELNVTAAAVGQLVRGLEDWLGVPLFHRGAGRSRLLAGLAPQGRLLQLAGGKDPLAVAPGPLMVGERGVLGSITGTPFENEKTLDSACWRACARSLRRCRWKRPQMPCGACDRAT
ncbi:hypothetical protein ABID26_000128 [Mesorhizobium shonense]|uniref:HTH lysR-type domain-containing protein n=1 Tax=Mesorhizobium shonense TaxID=1209948 RepID=A0ABV2HJL0_9HYPH